MDEIAYSLSGCTDAQVWAREFVKLVNKNPSIATDEGTMLTWFATAIMSGYDDGVKREQARSVVEKIQEIVFQAAGAATSVCMHDNPDYEFPSERVIEAVDAVCESFGIPKRLG